MSDIVWEDPGESRTGRAGGGKWQRFANELRKHPGKWAIARTGLSTPGTSLYTVFGKLGCECAMRVQSDRTYTVYARWPEVSP